MAEEKGTPAGSVDISKGIEINGEAYYPLALSMELNPCAGKNNGTSCGAGCVCRGGQCFYTLFRLQQMGIKLPDR